MRKSRISFSISKKASKNEGDEKFPVAATDTPTISSSQQTSLVPSAYFACRFCCKRFKTEKSYETHSKTKNHAKAVKSGTASELTKSRTCAGCHQAFETRPQLAEHCRRFSHMPMVQKTTLRNPVYGKAYSASEQEDPFVSIKYYSPYYCEVCDLDCVSDVHYQDHVKGTRHQKAMEKRAEQGRGVLVDLDTNEVDISEECLVIMNKSEPVTETVSAYYCGICDTDCRSELAYTEHVTSKDHQIRMQGHGQMKISCDLCCMTFTSENNYKMHLRSKKHASNVAARQRLLPLGAQEPEKGESVHDLRDKIKRTLSPPLENFDKIKVNVATVEFQDSAVRSVVINDTEIEAEEAPFMEMGRPNIGSKDKRERNPDVEKKLKEDEQEREKWAKKKAEDYAKKKATLEKSKESEKDRPSRWDTSEHRGSFSRGGGRGVRGRGRGRGARGGGGRGGRGGGRFGKDDKFTWVKPGYDDNSKSSSSKGDSHKERYSKNDRKGDREDKGEKRDKRDSKSDRREKRRSYDDERDSKKYDSDSDSDYGERVILEKRERKAERSPSTDDDGDDLRNVINKQRGKTKGSTEGAVDFSDDYDLKSASGQAGEDANSSLVFDYGHQPTGKGRERAELKGFFGGALSSIAGHFQRSAYEGEEELTMETERYFEEQRSASELSRSQFSSRAESTLEKTPPLKEDLTQNVEKTLLLELLKRQFPDIRYLTEQQGGLELMQRIFGEVGKGGGLGLGLGLGALGAGIDFGGGGGTGGGGGIGSDGGSGGGRKRDGPDGGRKVYSVADEVKVERGSQRRVLTKDDGVQDYGKDGRVVSEQSQREDGKKVSGVGRGQLDEGKRSQGAKSAAPGETTTAEKKEIKLSRQKSPEMSKEKPRGNKKELGKSASKDKRDSKKEQKRSPSRSRSRSKDRRKRSRSRSSSRSRSRNKNKYSSRKRSRSSSRERSSSKRSKRAPSPPAKSAKKDDLKYSTKRKGSVSPKDGDKQKKVEKKNGAETKSTEESEGKSEKKDGKDKDSSVVSQMKAKSKDAKEKALAKWTVSNWSGKEEKEGKKSQSEKEESVQKKTPDEDKKDQKAGSKRHDRRNEEQGSSSSDKEQTSRTKSSKDRDERKGSSKQVPSSFSRSKRTTENEGEGGKKSAGATAKRRDSEGDKIFEDASDYEEIDLDDIEKGRDLLKQFEDDYGALPEAQVKRRRGLVDDRERIRDPIDDRERLGDPIDDRQRRRDPIDDRARLRDEIDDRDLQALVIEAQQRNFPRAETASPLERGVSSVEGVRKSTLMSTESAEFDPYSYEDRAFEAQEDAEGPTALHPDLLASLARAGIPYQNLGYERFVAGQTSLASDYLSALGGITATRESPMSRGFVQGRGLFPLRGLDPGYGLAPGHGLPPSLGLTPGSELTPGGRLSLGRGVAPGSALGLGRALAPGSGLGLGSELGRGRGIQSTRGRTGRGRAVSSGSRNNSALMYIQPTEDEDQGRQMQAVSAPGKQTVKSTSSLTPLGSRLAMSQSSAALRTNENIIQTTSMAALRTISPVPLASRPAMSGKQERLPLKSSRLEQIQPKVGESDMSQLEEESYSEPSDSDQYPSTKPLKSILKKQSKFPSVEVPRSQPSDAEVLSSGNLPKNVVGAEYVVQSTSEQGKFFCQLCDVQFTTLSAKNLHLRGPKHLAMFMKHKSPLIDQMIQRAMGGGSQKDEDEENDADTRDSENRREDLDTKNISLGEPAGRNWRDVGTVEEKNTVIKREPQESLPLMSERSGALSRDLVQQSREPELEEKLVRGYPPGASSRPREEAVHEPRLYIDEKTGRFTQALDYYSESLSRKGEDIPEEYGRSSVREEQYSQAATTRERDRREGSLGSAREDYGSLASREKYGQVLSRDDYGRLSSRERDLLARDEYDRLLPTEQERGLPADYDRPLRREGTAGQEYGRLAAPDDYGRLPARDDYDRFVRREDIPPARDEYRRSATREQSLASSSDDLRRLPSKEAYDRPPSRDSFTNERDWRTARTPPLTRERTTDPRSDWSAGRSYDEPRIVNEPVAPDKRESSQYAASGKDKLGASRDWTPGTASTKEVAKGIPDEPRKSASEPVHSTSTDSAPGFPRSEVKSEPPETVENRRSPERYSRDDVKKRESPERYGSRSVADRREVPDSTYGQPSYREGYDRSYGGGEERYRGRNSDYDSRNDRRGQSGYGYNETPRRGGYRGTRGRGGSNMGPRGGPRGRKPGFNRGRGQWKGGQGRY